MFACDLFYMRLDSNSNLPITVNGTIQLSLELICYKLFKEKDEYKQRCFTVGKVLRKDIK